MLVLIAGMPRSGSTFSFNIVRELLVRRGVVYHEPHPCILQVIERSGHADHVIAKAHSAEASTLRLVSLEAVKVVCTVRRVEDAVASWMETFGFTLEQSILQMEAWLSMFENLPGSALRLDFEQVEAHPWRAARKIARHVCPDASSLEAFSLARRYAKARVKSVSDGMDESGPEIQNIGFSFYDKETYFHRRHVSDLTQRPAVQRIGSEAVEKIRHTFRDRLDERGYFLPNISQAAS